MTWLTVEVAETPSALALDVMLQVGSKEAIG